jgi:hypothetical protein
MQKSCNLEHNNSVIYEINILGLLEDYSLDIKNCVSFDSDGARQYNS